MKKAQVEEILGEALDTERTADYVVAYYYFDRGYIPPAERTDTQVPAAVFVGVMGLLTLGLAWTGTANCGDICQRGRLKVVYDSNNRLVAVKLPVNSHVDNNYCWTSGKRRPSCNAIASYPRPSTLSPVLAKQSSAFFRQGELER
jgi:hypothetical protein